VESQLENALAKLRRQVELLTRDLRARMMDDAQRKKERIEDCDVWVQKLREELKECEALAGRGDVEM
jgi:hypothetical protein